MMRRLLFAALLAACGGSAEGPPCPAPAAAPTAAPASDPSAPLRITSFTAASELVEYGEKTTLTWTIEGTPDDVLLDGVSVKDRSSIEVSPARRQRFTLTAKDAKTSDARNVEVAARGIDLLFGDLSSPGYFDGPADTAQFYAPEYVAIGPDGAVYVVEGGNSQFVRKIVGGVVSTIAGPPAIARATGIAVDGAGTVYVTDASKNAVLAIASSGIVTTIAGSGASGKADGPGASAQFFQPRGVVALPSGELLVMDAGNRLIRRIDTNHEVTTPFGLQGNDQVADSPAPPTFWVPVAATVDPNGNVWVIDACRVRKIAPGDVVTTYAGVQCGVPLDGPRSSAVFGQIVGIAVDADENVWISDMDANAIRRITKATDQVETIAGISGSYVFAQDNPDGIGTLSGIGMPVGLALRADGDVVFSDGIAHRIRSLHPASRKLDTIAGQRIRYGSVDGPRGANRSGGYLAFAVEPSGDIAITDSWNYTVRVLSPDGMLRTIAGTARLPGIIDGSGGEARFVGDLGITSDGVHRYVAEAGGFVRSVDLSGNVDTFTGVMSTMVAKDGPRGVGAFAQPQSIARDSKGNLYVADAGGYAIRVVRPDGSIETLAGGTFTGQVLDGKGASVRMTRPRALAVAPDDSVYFSDAGMVVRHMTPDGTVTTVAGTLDTWGQTDGPALQASFRRIEGMAIDAAGNVFVSDADSNAVRKLTPAGIVSTVAGTEGKKGLRAGPLPGSLFQPGNIAVTSKGDLVVSCGAGAIQITAP